MIDQSGEEGESFQPGFLPLDRAAAWVGVSVKSLKRWFERGLPYYQPCPRGRTLVKPGDIESFLTRQQAAKPELDRMVEEVMGELQGGKG